MNLKELFVILPKPANVMIDSVMVEKYRSICNHGMDTYSEAFMRITKSISLGELVYRYEDKLIFRYFDMCYECIDMSNRLILRNLWRNKKQHKIIKVSEVKKKKWNRKYGLSSHYEKIKKMYEIQEFVNEKENETV